MSPVAMVFHFMKVTLLSSKLSSWGNLVDQERNDVIVTE